MGNTAVFLQNDENDRMKLENPRKEEDNSKRDVLGQGREGPGHTGEVGV